MKTIVETTPIRLTNDAETFERRLVLAHVNSTAPETFPGWVELRLLDKSGNKLTVIDRFHLSGERLAAECMPTSSQHCIVDGNGRIANG